MPAGILVRDANGNVIVDNTTFMGRYLGQVGIGQGAGSLVNANFANGVPWVMAIMDNPSPIDTSTVTGTGFYDVFAWMTAPTWAVSGTTLTWNRPAASTLPSIWNYPSCTLVYGVR